jgi:hypothetical protein
MTIAYQKAILVELGPDISAELAENCVVFLVNYDDLTYTFQNCPPLLLEKIIARKESKKADVNSGRIPFRKRLALLSLLFYSAWLQPANAALIFRFGFPFFFRVILKILPGMLDARRDGLAFVPGRL